MCIKRRGNKFVYTRVDHCRLNFRLRQQELTEPLKDSAGSHSLRILSNIPDTEIPLPSWFHRLLAKGESPSAGKTHKGPPKPHPDKKNYHAHAYGSNSLNVEVNPSLM